MSLRNNDLHPRCEGPAFGTRGLVAGRMSADDMGAAQTGATVLSSDLLHAHDFRARLPGAGLSDPDFIGARAD